MPAPSTPDRPTPERHLPVRPNLEQLRHQAKDLLRDLRRGDIAAVEEFQRNYPGGQPPDSARLADAQLALARSYGLPNWPRLVTACRLIDAIWRDDADAVRKLVLADPSLLEEDARGVKGNWGPPMSYAANLGKDAIVEMLHGLGAEDIQFAFDRACLQSRIGTARRLHAMGAQPLPGSIMGPCETLSGSGLEFLLQMSASFADSNGDSLAPIGLILQTYCRNPQGKHRCLELAASHGIALPDTPTMAVHRGRIDLLEGHLRRDPQVLNRTFSHEEIYPLELGCDSDHSLALGGTPLDGGTLLHLCVDFDEIEMAAWLIGNGADVNRKSAFDADGFGGNTPLFGCMVSQPYRVGLRTDDAFARLLLDHGADANARASLRKRLRFGPDETMHEYRDVTPLGWGQQFHDQDWVSPAVMRLVAERGGSA
jgi:hypothetical protein